MKIGAGCALLFKYFARAFAVVLLLAVIYIKVMGVTRCTVWGQSMYPTLEDKEKLLISRKKTPDRFDLMVFTEGDTHLVKRVIGLPGDTIEVKEGQLSINGQVVDEPYVEKSLSKEYRDSSFHTKVGKGCYYVLGDNRDNSVDSRDFGPIVSDRVIGVVLCRLNLKKGLEKG